MTSAANPLCAQAAGRAKDARVMVENPFGTDLASARHLNATMHQYFGEESIYRVDHWLGLDAVKNVPPTPLKVVLTCGDITKSGKM